MRWLKKQKEELARARDMVTIQEFDVADREKRVTQREVSCEQREQTIQDRVNAANSRERDLDRRAAFCRTAQILLNSSVQKFEQVVLEWDNDRRADKVDSEPKGEPSLAWKLEHGQAEIIGIVPGSERGDGTVEIMAAEPITPDPVAEAEAITVQSAMTGDTRQVEVDRNPHPFGNEAAAEFGTPMPRDHFAQDVHANNERMWAAENARVDAVNRQLKEATVACDCGSTEQLWAYSPTLGRALKHDEEASDEKWYCAHHGPNTPYIAPVDDGAVPDPSEVDAILRAGICDSTALLGTPVLYETDRRGGKSYTLPATIMVLQKSHPDLAAWRSAEDLGASWNPITCCLDWEDRLQMLSGFSADNRGVFVEGNPVPIPHAGTVHLKISTPGPKGMYDELSVPYDPTGTAPRSWRFLENTANPF